MIPMNATELLAVPVGRPDRLFAGNDGDNDLLRKLRAQWHPDRHGGDAEAQRVFQHVNALYAERTKQLQHGGWHGHGLAELQLPGNQTFRINYWRQRPFELGTLFICRTSLVYVSDGSAVSKQLFARASRLVQTFKYADAAMEQEHSRYLPTVKSYIPSVTYNGSTGPALVIAKTDEVVALRDLLDYLGGKLDPRHVAWVLSSLHNLSCYLQWANLTHNAVDLDSYFISPQHHNGCLLGGWWYAVERRAPLQYLPAKQASLWRTFSADIQAAKVARHRLDRESIRLLGRELLGDPSGARVLHDPTVPKPLARWVSLPAGRDAISDYQAWVTVRDSSFAVRKFTELPITAAQIYAPRGA